MNSGPPFAAILALWRNIGPFKLFAAAVAAAVALLTIPAQAIDAPLIIRDDPGGDLMSYVAKVQALQQSGRRVEIRGVCDSACTMLLSVACVSPNARLGFHGPSSGVYGIALPPAEHDYWARVMASHYPPQLANWYMQSAQHQILRMISISGREAIRLGATPCA